MTFLFNCLRFFTVGTIDVNLLCSEQVGNPLLVFWFRSHVVPVGIFGRITAYNNVDTVFRRLPVLDMVAHLKCSTYNDIGI